MNVVTNQMAKRGLKNSREAGTMAGLQPKYIRNPGAALPHSPDMADLQTQPQIIRRRWLVPSAAT